MKRPYDKKSDKELIELYQENDNKEILGELYKRYHLKVLNYCSGFIKERNQASDIAQDVFVKVSEQINKLQKPELFQAWLFRIARNLCIDYLKLKGREAKILTEEQYQLAEDYFDEEEAIKKDKLIEKLILLIDQSPNEVKNLLLDRYFHNKSIKQLQIQYERSESALKMRLARARKQLAELIKEDKRG